MIDLALNIEPNSVTNISVGCGGVVGAAGPSRADVHFIGAISSEK